MSEGGTQAKVDHYAVIGNPIAHSKSPQIHAQFAHQTQQHLRYVRLLAPLDGFADTVREFIHAGGRGMNVTVPFKLQAATLATRLTARAQAAGAVNTLSFAGQEMIGDNTDGTGLVRDIVHNAGRILAGKSILLLGAGGAARGVLLPLLEQHPACLILSNRTLERAQELATHFANYRHHHVDTHIECVAFDRLGGPFDVVINATAASLSSETLPIPPSVFTPNTLAYDMMYANCPTAFMTTALEHGAQARDGLGMLVEQAAESFFLWRGIRPETHTVFARLRTQLDESA